MDDFYEYEFRVIITTEEELDKDRLGMYVASLLMGGPVELDCVIEDCVVEKDDNR